MKAIEEVIKSIGKPTELEKAERELKDFLAENPNLKVFQKEIDRLLDLAITPENKLVVLQFMIAGNLSKLADELTKLQKIALEVK